MRGSIWLASALLAAPAGAATLPPACTADAPLHVPSPDWRDQVIYFALLDRFDDGDPARNEQGLGEYRPNEEGGYSGGDLQGVINRLDYIRTLGATAIWTTPPFANQWWVKEVNYSGSHGYWPRDFTKIDEHYGDLGTYQALACQLHQRRMYLVMDIVVNHVGNYFDYGTPGDPPDPRAGYREVAPGSPSDKPLTPPFDQNDPRDPAQLKAGIYHWTPVLRDYANRDHELRYQLGGLDDINTANPRVRAAFKTIYGDWIRKAGIDGFRIDTVKYVEPDFFTDFLKGPGGVAASARATGRRDFLVFGEVKENAPAFTASGEAKMRLYLNAGFPSLINFPLQEELVRVLGEGLPTRALRYRLDQFLALYPDPTLAANFVDNHDVPRLRGQASGAALRQALGLIFTLPGIPIIYQGDEQELRETRAAMFPRGYHGAEGRFDTQAPMFRHIRALADLRRALPALRRGTLRVLADNPTDAGGFAFLRETKGETLIVALNSADRATLLANIATGLAPGSRLEPVFGGGDGVVLDAGGGVSLALEARAMRVFRLRPALKARAVPAPVIDRAPGKAPIAGATIVSGRYARPGATLRFVRDGDLDRAKPVPVGSDGRWRYRLEAKDYGARRHFFELYAPDSGRASRRVFYQSPAGRPLWQVPFADAAHDDVGPSGDYAPPTEAGFAGRQDLLGAQLRGGGETLELELEMAALGHDWQPANGFDHVAFTIFFAFPGTPGAARFEDLRLPMPPGFDWSHAHLLFGWGNHLLRQGGEEIAAAPAIKVDDRRRTITITYRASDFGRADWRGARLYVTTYDRRGEGDPRPLTRTGGPQDFRGPPDGPLMLDSMLIDLAGVPVR